MAVSGDEFFKSKHYFNLGEALQDAKSDFNHGETSDKLKSSAKLVGKSLFNTGLFAGKLGVEMVKRAPQHMAQRMQEHLDSNPNMTQEKRTKAEEFIERTRK